LYQRWAPHFGVDVLDGISMTEMLHIFLSNRPGAARPGSTGIAVPGVRPAHPRRRRKRGRAGHPGHAGRARRLHRDRSRGESGEERAVLVAA
jgi:acyl-coenzyme A synthetase/AMP-(fatty) acid ligase